MILGENNEVSFNGKERKNHTSLPLADVDFSLCVHIKTKQPGNIVSNFPGNKRWTHDSKALFVDATGNVKFVSGREVLCQSYSFVNDDKWHEIAVVYSSKDTRYFKNHIEFSSFRYHTNQSASFS